jgi:PIN domain nuclease of toxin-antitoxin system
MRKLKICSVGANELRVLLDTAVFIFAVEAPRRLTTNAATILKNPENVRELSSVSLTEIAIKTTLGKLSISADDARKAIQDMDIRILPFTADHAFRLFQLPAYHRDPFDRQIIAQAFWENIPVVTSDNKFSLYKGLKLIW